jgi:hypothetical protein
MKKAVWPLVIRLFCVREADVHGKGAGYLIILIRREQ